MGLAAKLSSNKSFFDSNQDCVLNSESFLFNTLNDMKYYLFALAIDPWIVLLQQTTRLLLRGMHGTPFVYVA